MLHACATRFDVTGNLKNFAIFLETKQGPSKVEMGQTSPETDENGSDTNGYYQYYICFHISGRIRIRIRIMSIMSDKVRLVSTS